MKWNNLDNGNIQQGSKLTLANTNENETETAYKTETKTTEYLVEKGDNLATIAKKHDVAVSDLKDWNHIDDSSIQAGMKLIVSKKLIVTTDSKLKPVKKENIATVQKEKAKLYQVKKGDSLFSIAKKSGVTISDIKKWNQDIKVESLKPGMKLKING